MGLWIFSDLCKLFEAQLSGEFVNTNVSKLPKCVLMMVLVFAFCVSGNLLSVLGRLNSLTFIFLIVFSCLVRSYDSRFLSTLHILGLIDCSKVLFVRVSVSKETPVVVSAASYISASNLRDTRVPFLLCGLAGVYGRPRPDFFVA